MKVKIKKSNNYLLTIPAFGGLTLFLSTIKKKLFDFDTILILISGLKYMNISIGLVDDHVLFSKSLASLLQGINGFNVVVDARHGADLMEKLITLPALPDVILVDVEMPIMDGEQTARTVKSVYPSIKLIALSMNDSDNTVLSMIRAGCCSYLLKDTSPQVLEEAIREVHVNSYYNSEIHLNSLGRLLVAFQSGQLQTGMNEIEMEFLRLATSEMSYKDIADSMNVSERTVDGYRASVFEKLKVQSRTGMVLEALRKGLIKL
ncbi:MAG: response regulator transcription factor [Cyclobacteriaceae bacterium]|nr:response regulator transcription factor [Cyclobacteriaceae bacterium]